MRKKLLTLAMAATMAVSTVISAFADANTITGGWWTAWTPGYEVKDTLEFDIDVKGGSENWNNVSAVFVNGKTTGTAAPADEVGATYKEYAVVRADSWGWGGGDNKSLDGNDIVYTSDIVDTNANGDTWDEFKAIMADAHIDATVTKTATGVELVYEVKGANGESFKYTATTDVDTSEGLYVFFACDTSEVTVALAEDKKDDAADKKDDTADKKDDSTKATTTKAATEDEEGMNPVVIVVIVVVAVVVVGGIVVVTKKKN